MRGISACTRIERAICEQGVYLNNEIGEVYYKVMFVVAKLHGGLVCLPMGLSEEECIETKSYTLVKSCSYGLHEYREL
jgi:hypothetical protein